MKPVEGTILTVVAAAAGADCCRGGRRRHWIPCRPDRAERGSCKVAKAARTAAVGALWETPTLLPVLAAAGVVDAGGAGLVVLFDAFLKVIDGRAPPDSP